MKDILLKIENAFGLPEGIMLKKGPFGQPYRAYYDTSLSEIRRALCWHLSQKHKPKEIYTMLNLDHATYAYQMKKAINYIATKDFRFHEYLIIVQRTIPIEVPDTITHMGHVYERKKAG